MELSLDYFFREKKRFLQRVPHDYSLLNTIVGAVIVSGVIAAIQFHDDAVAQNKVLLVLVVVVVPWIAYWRLFKKSKVKNASIALYARYDALTPGLDRFWELLRVVIFASAGCYFLYDIFYLSDFKTVNWILLLLCIFVIADAGKKFLKGKKPSREMYITDGTMYITEGATTYFAPTDLLAELRLQKDMITLKATSGLVDRIVGYGMSALQMSEVAMFVTENAAHVIIKTIEIEEEN
jgi:hypothetical protein